MRRRRGLARVLLVLSVVSVSVPLVVLQSGFAGATPQASSWRLVPHRHQGTFTGVAGLSSSDVWAVGYYYDQPTGRYLPTTEHWDGTRFTFVSVPPATNGANAFNAVAMVSSSDVWAVGYHTPVYYTTDYSPLIEHWNGSAWTIVPSPFQGEANLTAVAAISSNDVWAVGSRTSLNSGSLLLHWNGIAWSVVQDGHATDTTILKGVSAISATNVLAAGSTLVGTERGSFVERWDGSTWTAEATPNDSEYNEFSAVAADPSGIAWGVGWKSPGYGYFEFSERYDGASWTIESTPEGPPNNNLYGVVMASPTKVWAVGYDSINGPSPVIQHWDGTKWVIEPDPVKTCCILYGIARAGQTLWAVGDNVILRRGI